MDLKHPFENDPFAIVWQAFQNLYPGKECEVSWCGLEEEGEGDEDVVGLTIWADDGSIQVLVDPKRTVEQATETLAHELAHVAVDPDEGHGPEWEAAFEKIFQEYNRIGDEMFPDDEEENHGQNKD